MEYDKGSDVVAAMNYVSDAATHAQHTWTQLCHGLHTEVVCPRSQTMWQMILAPCSWGDADGLIARPNYARTA